MPENSDALRRLSSSLGFSSPKEFNATLREHMRQVRTIFRRVISEPTGPAEGVGENLRIFRDEKRAAKSLADAKDIKAARTTFKSVSSEVIAALKQSTK